MDFQYNKDRKTYFLTKKLDFGYISRIYFFRDSNNDYLENKPIFYVAIAIAKSKKELNNWIYGIGESSIDVTSQYIGYGLSVLMWAKECIQEFLKNYYSTLIIYASNTKRYKVYKWALKDFKESSYKIDKHSQDVKILYKVSEK